MLKQKIVTIINLTLLGLAALVLAFLTILGTAFLTDSALSLVIAAIGVLCVGNLVGQHLLLGRHLTLKTLTIQVSSTLVLLSIFYEIILMPIPGERLPDQAGVAYWNLSTGSRIAYTKITPEHLIHAEPIVFLHGGPGIADMEGDSAYFGKLREVGYVVYVYDQLGTGRSSRLEDPSRYTIERDAADLEEIRKKIGVEKMILIGYSYGASLAAMYIAHHGEHVAKFIAISPGALMGGVAGGGAFQQRLTASQKWSIYARILQPRALTAYALLQINPRAAHDFAGDSEMDARNDDVYAVAEPALHCDNKGMGYRLYGLGFYASQFPLSIQRTRPEDITQSLKRYKIPTLVFKGSCDYLTWASALDYLDALQAGPAQLVYLSGAGHPVFQDKPREFELNLEAFLNGQPLPNRYFDRIVPADYERGQ